MTEADFSDHYRKLNRSVLNFVRGALRRDQTAIADDIASESWLLAWRSREHWAGSCSFKTWVCTIAMNQIRTHWRSIGAESNGGNVQIISLSRIYSAQHPDTGPMSKVTNRLHAARQIARIRPSAVTLLSMKYVYGSSDQELADELQWPVGTVKTRIFRIRERARKQLG